MANQPAKNSTAIYLRLPQTVKDAIQVEVNRLNADNSGANANITSWIKAAINDKLKADKKKSSKK